MTKQVNSSKQTSRTLTEKIKEEFEKFYEPITSCDYYGELAIEDGGKVVRVPTFAINGKHLVYVHDEIRGVFQRESIAQRQERQRKFGQNVRLLMDEYGFSWELGKVVLKAHPTASTVRTILCERILEIREDIVNNSCGWKEQFAKDPEKTMQSIIYWYDLNYWLNTRNYRLYNALKDYLFADN